MDRRAEVPVWKTRDSIGGPGQLGHLMGETECGGGVPPSVPRAAANSC